MDSTTTTTTMTPKPPMAALRVSTPSKNRRFRRTISVTSSENESCRSIGSDHGSSGDRTTTDTTSNSVEFCSREFGTPNCIRSEFRSSLRLRPRHNSFKLVADSLQLGQLRFDKLGLVGRDAQAQLLKDCLANQEAKRQLILISGEAGTGKSALALAMKEQSPNVLVGDFGCTDQEDRCHAAIVDCCHELVAQILAIQKSNANKYNQICQGLRTELLDIEMVLLATVVPILDKLDVIERGQEEEPPQELKVGVGVEEQTTVLELNVNATSSWKNNEHKLKLFESALAKFWRLASFHFSNLVLVLDNLQRASATDLSFLQAILQDSKIPNSFVVCGCYRSEEADKLAEALRQFRDHTANHKIHLTEITLPNFGVSEIHETLVKLLAMEDYSDDKNLIGLSELCFKRTMGNVYFLRTFLQMLKQKDLIEYDLNVMAWRWDLLVIEAETAAAENVVDILIERMMQSSHKDMVELLKFAACLGSTLHRKTLSVVWEHLTQSNLKNVATLLEEAVEETFFETVYDDNNTDYRWAHNEVLEAASSLVPEDEFTALQLKVGNTLVRYLSDEDLEKSIFIVANLLNNSTSPSIELAEINLRAAKKATQVSAFLSSEKYAAIGVARLPQDVWNSSHYDIAIELYSLGAEAAGGLGDMIKMEEYCQVVLQRPDIPIMDKLRCYNVQIENMGKRKRPKEAMNLALDVMGFLGCKFPRGSVSQTIQAISKLHKVRKNKDNIKLETALKLPLMSDPKKIEIMKLLEKVALYAYLSQSSMVYLLATIYGVEWTIRDGLAEESPSFGFCSLGIVLMHLFGEWEVGPRYAEIGLSLLENLEKKYMVAAVVMVAHTFILCWVHPWSSRIKHFMEGYEKGMQVGDTEFATHNLGSYLFSSFVSGKKLDVLEVEFEHFVPQIETLNNLEQAAWVRIYWQAVLNLMGKDENTIELSGSAMEETEFLKQLETFQSKQQLCGLKIFQSYLCVIFGAHERGAALALERGDQFLQDAPGLSVTMLDPFVRGMSLYAMAQTTRRRKYRTAAKKARKKIASWAQKGNVNVVHQLKLLDAEHAVLSKKNKDKISTLYKEAISFAIRCGCIQDAALANERFGAYLLKQTKDDFDDATHYLRAAVDYYSDWGANRKVDMLHLKYGSIVSS